MKNRKLHQWVWKWHFLAGLVSLPFILLLAITGGVYLFNPQVETKARNKIQDIEQIHTAPISYQKQLEIAVKALSKKPSEVRVPESLDKSTEFVIGKFSHKKSVFINPYTGEVSGKFSPKDTWMYSVRKLHGELLGGKIGTKVVELIASWMIILILSGLYIWWPFKRGIKGVFTIRMEDGQRTFFRDIHAVVGFWFSGLLLITLAGGLPWTDVFGSMFKKVQEVTNTGYPETWNGMRVDFKKDKLVMPLDSMIAKARKQELTGAVFVGLPQEPDETFSVYNTTVDLERQKKFHFNPYSGALVKQLNWADVGMLMRARMWLMAFHQGQFGAWNLWLMLGVAIALTLMCIGAIVSYLSRKRKGEWGIPKHNRSFKLSSLLMVVIMFLGLLLPLFGISLLSIVFFEWIRNKQVKIKFKK